jgi:hypothetical protein
MSPGRLQEAHFPGSSRRPGGEQCRRHKLWETQRHTMSKTRLVAALQHFDLEQVRAILKQRPELKQLELDKRLNLLQFIAKRFTGDQPIAAKSQLRLAKWLVGEGFDPKALYATPPGEDGEEESSQVSLAWFAVAKAQNTRLAKYFLEQGAAPHALFAAAWWGNGDILPELVRHGATLDEVVGATPLHMAVDVVRRGAEGRPQRARQRLKCVEVFLRLGANPNIPAYDGTTPLHTALHKEYLDAFKLLLRHGADPDVPGKDGRTVREIASRKRDKRYSSALPARNAGAMLTPPA